MHLDLTLTRAKFEELMDEIRSELIKSNFNQLSEGMSNVSPEQMARMKDMLADLNQMLEARGRGEEPDFDAFMEKYSDFFPGNPATLDELLEQMAHRYADRIIVFDSPPLLVTTESRVLATHMGQVVLVVEAERTTHGHVRQALSTIDNCPIRLMVLNKSRERSVGGYYGYGYGYGYGQGQEHNPEAA